MLNWCERKRFKGFGYDQLLKFITNLVAKEKESTEPIQRFIRSGRFIEIDNHC